MMSYDETKQMVSRLLGEPPLLGTERLPGAKLDEQRLRPAIANEVRAFTISPEQSRSHNRDYRNALLRISSIECAAGASIERCRAWFHGLASLSAWAPPDTAQPVDVADAAIWSALAGQFEDSIFAAWPDDPDTESVSDRIVYRLLTRKTVRVDRTRNLFEEEHWEKLCLALEGGLIEPAARAFRSIADWWGSEYQACETPAYDPEHFCTFEPAPNAALAIALVRDSMPLWPLQLVHERFYYVALSLARSSLDAPSEGMFP